MKKHLTPSLTTTKGNMTPLFFLDMILDTDFGLISLINKEFLDPHVFDKEKFKDLKISPPPRFPLPLLVSIFNFS